MRLLPGLRWLEHGLCHYISPRSAPRWIKRVRRRWRPRLVPWLRSRPIRTTPAISFKYSWRRRGRRAVSVRGRRRSRKMTVWMPCVRAIAVRERLSIEVGLSGWYVSVIGWIRSRGAGGWTAPAVSSKGTLQKAQVIRLQDMGWGSYRGTDLRNQR